MKNLDLLVSVLILSLLVYFAYDTFVLQKEVKTLSTEINQTRSMKAARIFSETATANESRVLRSAPIVAVDNNSVGSVGSLTVEIIPGNGEVLINTNPFSEPDLQDSINNAVAIATSLAGYDPSNADFIFDYNAGDAQLIGGPSSGAAATVATFAALTNMSVRNDTALTGTIELDYSVGQVGDVPAKAKAAADAGYKVFLVPAGQSAGGLKQTAKKQWGMNVTEIGTIDDALKYMLE